MKPSTKIFSPEQSAFTTANPYRVFTNLPLRSKIVLTFIGMTVITVVTLTALISRVTQTQLLASLGTNLKGQAVAQGSAIGALMDKQINSLRAFGLNQLLIDKIIDANAGYSTDQQAIQSQLDELDQQWTASSDAADLIQSHITGDLADALRAYGTTFPGNVEVFVTDRAGALLAASNRTSDYNQSDETWWQAAWNNGTGNIFISEPTFDESSQSFSLDIAIPIYEQINQQAIGVLRTTYSLATLASFVDNIHFGQTGRARLLMRREQMLETGGNKLVPIDPQTAARLQIASELNYVTLQFENVPSLISQAPVTPARDEETLVTSAIDSLGWTILIQQDSRESLQPLDAANQVAVFASLGTLVLATILALILSRVLSTPIKRLTETVRQIAAGDLSQRAVIKQHDEIGQLALVFNGMTEHLNALIHALELGLDEAQLARERAERSDQVKSAFLASVSHELRTPLNAIINYTKFVAKEVMGPINERQRDSLNRVVNSAKLLLQLINDVLDISKIESGSLTLFIEEDVDVNELLKTVVSTAEGLLAEKPVKLIQDIDADLPLMIGDKQRILQVMHNIISNACKFTDEGTIKIRAYSQDDNFHFSVEDTGPGIALEDYTFVFEAFKQTQTGLHKGEGTGLGMPISKRLAEAHGGTLWFESTPGHGSTFYVKLPIKQPEVVAV